LLKSKGSAKRETTGASAMAVKQVIRELITKWGFDIDSKPLKEAEGGVDKLKTSLKVITAVSTGAAVGVYKFVKTTAEGIDTVTKAARNIGLTAQELLELQYAAGLSGASNEQLNDILKDLTKNSIEAAGGNKGLRLALRAMGIDADKFVKLPIDKKLEAVSDGLKGVNDPGLRAQLRMKLLGEQGIKMASLLDGGSEAIRKMRQESRELGLVLSQETAQKAEELNDTIDKIKFTVKAVKDAVAIELIPEVLDIAKATLTWTKESKELLKLRIKQGIMLTVEALKFMGRGIKTVVSLIQSLISWLGGLERVMRVVQFIMTAFISYQALAGIVSFIKMIRGLIAAYRLLGMSALLAQAKMLLIPIAIGALLALIAYLIEDFDKFFKGQNSAIGELVKKFPELGKAIYFIRDVWNEAGVVAEEFFLWLFKMWPKLKQEGWDAIWGLVDGWNNMEAKARGAWKNIHADAMGVILDLTGRFSKMLGTILEGADAIPGIELSLVKDLKAKVDLFNTGASKIGPSSTVSRDASNGASNRRTPEVRSSYTGSPITVVQKPGESTDDLAKRISKHQKAEMDKQAREIKENFTTAYVY